MKTMHKYPLYKWVLALSDLLVLNFSFAVALRLRFMPHIDVINISSWKIAQQWTVFLIYSFFWIFIFHYFSLYKRHIIFTRSKQLVALIQAIFTGFLGFLLFQFIIRPFRLVVDSRLLYIYFILISITSFALFRLVIVRYLFRRRWLGNIFTEKALIIGAGKRGKLVAASILEDKEFQTEIVGFLDDRVALGTKIYDNIFIIGRVKDLDFLVQKYSINSVYIAIDNISKNRLFDLISFCTEARVYVYISSDKLEIINKKIANDFVRDLPIVRANYFEEDFYTKYLKPIFDFTLSILLLVILSPLLLVVSIGVRLSSPGPILFKQERIGKNGKPFKFLKFRSMLVGSDQDESRKAAMRDFIIGKNNNNSSTKVVNSARITPFGKFIRKYSIDELPQLINVIKGEMSLIGPRPALPYEVEQYDEWHRRRLKVKPGCSGLWQVTARSEVSFDDSVILDIYYIKNISPWLDLLILLKTIPVILKGQGGK
jgi:exopolysaccharide biosynthesis polyprenyl glycosylphosphotransferase